MSIEELYREIDYKDEAKALEIISENPTGLNINWKNENNHNMTCLHVACYRNLAKVIEKLLNYPDIDVNVQNKYGWTPIYLACLPNNVEVLKLLLNDDRTDVIKADNDFYTPLMGAAFYGNLACVEHLLASLRHITKIDDALKEAKKWTNQGTREVVLILEQYLANPAKTVKALRIKLQLQGSFQFISYFSFFIIY